MQTVQAALQSYAQKYEVTPAQMALTFLLVHPIGIVPIIDTQTPDRIIESAQALNIKLARQDWYALYVSRRGAAMP